MRFWKRGKRPERVSTIGAVILSATLGAWTAPADRAEAEEGPQCVVPPFGVDRPALRSGRLPQGYHAPSRAPAATVGNVHLLVILAEFPDRPWRVTPNRLEQHLFGAGTTLRDYYATMSSGHLDVTGDVVGWFTLPAPQFVYSQGNGGLGTYPNNAQRMVEDAVSAAVSGGVELGDYDADGDGEVDALLVIHSAQGLEWTLSPGASFPDPDAINSHRWVTLQSDFGSGAAVRDYFTCPELQLVDPAVYPAWSDSVATIGVFCHEFGHVLGLPDLYDTNTSLNRVGIWDVMDYGTWNRDPSVAPHSAPGALPSGTSIWCRMFLGWESPIEIAPPAGETTTQAITLRSASLGFPALQLRANPGGVDWTASSPGRGEYFLAEVRTRHGYDRGLPAEGLLVYHVDETEASNREADAAVPGGGLLVLVPQDGHTGLNSLPTDPWPGVQSTFNAASDPSSDLHGGEASGVEIADITEGAESISATVTVTNLSPTPPFPFPRPSPWRPALQGDVEIVLAPPGSGGDVRIRIHDVRGRPVRTLDEPGEFLEAGRVGRWDGRDDAGKPVPAGVYAYRAEGAAPGTGKLVLLR